MVSADVHEMESPSPLATPGYLPLLSEASTPLTPAASPRISFKSFTLPLEVEPLAALVEEPLQSCLAGKLDRNQDHSTGPQSPIKPSSSGPMEAEGSEPFDQEMTPCERLIDLTDAAATTAVSYHG